MQRRIRNEAKELAKLIQPSVSKEGYLVRALNNRFLDRLKLAICMCIHIGYIYIYTCKYICVYMYICVHR